MKDDVLHLALREMKPGEILTCTQKTFQAIRDRLAEFKARNRYMTFNVKFNSETGSHIIKRVA